jgi:uncharacterized membrane protein
MRTTSETNSATPNAPVSRETEYVTRAAWRAGILGALNALFIVLAVRAILLVAVVGAIILASAVMASPDPWRLGALGIYALVVVGGKFWPVKLLRIVGPSLWGLAVD